MKDRIKGIRKFVTSLGFNSRQVSVRGDYSSVNITIKCAEAYDVRKEIEEGVRKFEQVSRCSVSGEILSGGNFYVFVAVDSEVRKELASIYLEDARMLFDRVMAECKTGQGLSHPEKDLSLMRKDATHCTLFARKPGDSYSRYYAEWIDEWSMQEVALALYDAELKEGLLG